MTPLQQSLYDFCLENRADTYLAWDQKEYQQNQDMAQWALEQLEAAGEPWAGLADRVEYGLNTTWSLQCRAMFLSGLWAGQTLSRL